MIMSCEICERPVQTSRPEGHIDPHRRAIAVCRSNRCQGLLQEKLRGRSRDFAIFGQHYDN